MLTTDCCGCCPVGHGCRGGPCIGFLLLFHGSRSAGCRFWNRWRDTVRGGCDGCVHRWKGFPERSQVVFSPPFLHAGVVPDAETRFLLLAIFGPRSRPVRKCQRMLYWLPRMLHANPYPLPAQLPPPGLAAACLGLRRIANDPDARLSVYQVGDGGVTWRGQRGDEGERWGRRGWGMWGGKRSWGA